MISSSKSSSCNSSNSKLIFFDRDSGSSVRKMISNRKGVIEYKERLLETKFISRPHDEMSDVLRMIVAMIVDDTKK